MMEKDIQNWLDLSHYDLKTAEAMFSSRALSICPFYLPAGGREDVKRYSGWKHPAISTQNP